MREQLLFDAAFGAGVKVLDVEDALADLVELLDAPASVVEFDEVVQRVVLVSCDQGGAEVEGGTCDLVFEQAHSQRDDVDIGQLPADVALVRRGRIEEDLGIGLGTREEVLHHRGHAFLQAKDSVDAAVVVLVEQRVGEVSPVVDDDVVVLERIEVTYGTEALVAVRDEVEIEGQLRFELV